MTIDANLVQDNLANDDGGGIRFLQAGNDRINVTNNIVTNNVSTHEGGGFALDDSTNVRIVGNTVMKNLTTATAITSNGKPAPAGLSTATNSDQLQATLSTAGGTPRYSKPLLVDNIFSDNRAGTWDPAAGIVRGIGATGDSTAPNIWDLGSLNPLTSRNGTANLLSPTYSLLSKADPQVTTNATDKIGQNPGVVSAYDVSVRILTSRTFPTFREAVIVANAVAPDLQGNYHLGSAASPAANAGNRTSLLSAGLADVNTLMGHDVDAQPRATGGPTTPIDIGADEIP